MRHESNGGEPPNDTKQELEPQREAREEFQLEIGIAQELGNRLGQEDSYKQEHNPQYRRTIVAIADGVGGSLFGEVASRMAVDLFCKYTNEYKKISEEVLKSIVRTIQATFTAFAEGNTELRDMGTTLTAVIIEGNNLWTVHIGDSRLYMKRGNALTQKTSNHTLATLKKSVGEPVGPLDENTLTRSVRPNRPTAADITQDTIVSGDQLVLVTDGVFKCMDEDAFKTGAMATLEQKTGQAAAHEMLARAITHDMDDNGTAVVILIKEKK